MAPPEEPRPDDPLGLIAQNHPLREGLSYEMHLRRLPRFAAPARLLQVVVLVDEAAAARAHAGIAALQAEDAPPLPAAARHARFALGPLSGVWERHAEFVTYGFLLAGGFTDAFDPAAFAAARPFLARLPGPVIRATLVALTPPGREEACARWAEARFGLDGLVACDVAGGKARLWSDFRLAPNGMGLLLIADRGLSGDEPAQLVQRLQELGNYRNMALLGLPLAHRLTPELNRLEQRLAALTTRFAEPAAPDEPLLEEIVLLSAELARLLAEARYRMSATEAYARIVEDRLASLDVMPLAGHQTLTDFTDRRLTPAVRTCASVSQRLDELSRRAAWTSDLLRTRIDTALARQNRDLLGSMDRRTHLQLRLQQAVEGLSVVAISYYLLALAEVVLRAVPRLDHDLVAAVLAPVIMLAVTLQLRRLHHRIAE